MLNIKSNDHLGIENFGELEEWCAALNLILTSCVTDTSIETTEDQQLERFAVITTFLSLLFQMPVGHHSVDSDG